LKKRETSREDGVGIRSGAYKTLGGGGAPEGNSAYLDRDRALKKEVGAESQGKCVSGIGRILPCWGRGSDGLKRKEADILVKEKYLEEGLPVRTI